MCAAVAVFCNIATSMYNDRMATNCSHRAGLGSYKIGMNDSGDIYLEPRALYYYSTGLLVDRTTSEVLSLAMAMVLVIWSPSKFHCFGESPLGEWTR